MSWLINRYVCLFMRSRWADQANKEADGRRGCRAPDLLPLISDPRLAVRKPRGGVTPTHAAVGATGLDHEEHLRVGPGRPDEGEHGPIDDRTPVRDLVAVDGLWQQAHLT